MLNKWIMTLVVALGLTVSEGGLLGLAAKEGADRPYLLETIDDAAVVQLYADGFEALLLGEKT